MANYKLTHTGPEVDAAVAASLAGYTPEGTYANLATLNAAIPAGNSNVYLTADNGYWNYWNGVTWTPGASYSGAGASVAIGTTTTGEAGTDAAVNNSGTDKDAVFNFTIPRGATGATGAQGATGPKGDTGATGPQGEAGSNFTVKALYTTLEDLNAAHPTGEEGDAYAVGTAESNTTYIWDVDISHWKDVGSLKGPQGDAGKGIVSIVRTSGTGAPGTTDTYTVTYSDASTTTFNVYNGADGQGAGDMLKSVYDTNNDGVVNSAHTLSGLTTTIAELNFVHGLTSAVQTQLNAKLPLSGGTMTGAINEALVNSMALASTMAIGAAAGNYIIVTAGTGPITAFDTITAGARRFLRFAVSTSITYNATSMLLPGAANLSVAAGDVLEFVSGGSGIWRCVNIQPWGAWSVALGGTGASTAAGARTNLGVGTAGTLASETTVTNSASYLPTGSAIVSHTGRSTAVTAADTNYTSYMARGEALASADTTPSQNGQICWTYK